MSWTNQPLASPKSEIKLNTIYALIALLTGLCKRKLAEADHALSLRDNMQLKNSDKITQDQQFKDAEYQVSKRLSILRKNLFLSFLFLSSALVVAWATNTYRIGMSLSPNILAGFSVFCFAWATLGRLGWEGQSYKGNSSVEKIDNKLFFAIYWLGTYLGTISIL